MQSLEVEDPDHHSERDRHYLRENPYYRPSFHLCFKSCFRALGVALIFFFTMIVLMMFYSYIYDITIIYHHAFENWFITIVIF